MFEYCYKFKMYFSSIYCIVNCTDRSDRLFLRISLIKIVLCSKVNYSSFNMYKRLIISAIESATWSHTRCFRGTIMAARL